MDSKTPSSANLTNEAILLSFNLIVNALLGSAMPAKAISIRLMFQCVSGLFDIPCVRKNLLA